MSTFKKYIKKPAVLMLCGACILIIMGIIFLGGKQKSSDDLVTVKSATVSEGVHVTGNVKSAQAVDLGFEKAGTIATVSKDVGDKVSEGDVLVSLSNADVQAQLAQAYAAVKFQQAKLAEAEKGTRPESLDITRIKVLNAENDLSAAQASLVVALQTSYSSTEDAIHNKADEFFNYARTAAPHLNYAPFDPGQVSAIESGRAEVEVRLNLIAEEMTKASTTSNLVTLSTQIGQNIAEAKLFLDNLSLVMNSAIVPAQTKADLAAARSEVNTAISSLLSAKQAYTTAQSALALTKSQLSLDQAGSVSDEISALEAQVAEASANVASIRANLAKTYIRSPISGIVTKQNAKVGQVASANSSLVSVISDAQFEMDAYIAEADIAKVSAGEKASVTLDAYGPDIFFNAVVVSIDPAETIRDNVPTYKTTLQFNAADTRIKSGMTANIDIKGTSHENVLALPQRAIITHDSVKYVRLKNGNDIREVPIVTGIRGDDGTIEIISGLHVGDTVAISKASS